MAAVSKFVPPGFDESRVLAGLHKAIGFGMPTRVDDRATFFFQKRPSDTSPADGAGVPFDPGVQLPDIASPRKLSVDCTVDYVDAAGKALTFGDSRPSGVVITLLDAEYQKIKDYAFVVAGGDKYVRSRVEPPIALGSIDVWTLHATAESER